MSKSKLFIAALLSTAIGLSSCHDDHDHNHPKKEHEEENSFVRVLVSDMESNAITLINPHKGEVQGFTAQFPGNSLYATTSGRYAAVMNTANNYVQFFDSGIEVHEDHAHLKGTPKWAKTTATAPKPTHFYASGNHIAIFNDGDGSLSLASEGTLHTAESADHVVVGEKHHGAVVRFDNGTFAVTEKDGSVAGALPERVKIIDRNGNLVSASTVATRGIHGDAGDGKLALFGSASGILKVNENGTQSLISYPESFGANWLGAIHYGRSAGTFIGYKREMGVYFIDVAQNSIKPVIESTTLVSAGFDAAGKDILVLMNDGKVVIFDGKSGAKKAERVLPLTIPADKKYPTLTATKNFVYVTVAERGEVLMLKRENLSDFGKYKVSGKPGKLVILGGDVNGEHNH